jgi:hypothetical protein
VQWWASSQHGNELSCREFLEDMVKEDSVPCGWLISDEFSVLKFMRITKRGINLTLKEVPDLCGGLTPHQRGSVA